MSHTVGKGCAERSNSMLHFLAFACLSLSPAVFGQLPALLAHQSRDAVEVKDPSPSGPEDSAIISADATPVQNPDIFPPSVPSGDRRVVESRELPTGTVLQGRFLLVERIWTSQSETGSPPVNSNPLQVGETGRHQLYLSYSSLPLLPRPLACDNPLTLIGQRTVTIFGKRASEKYSFRSPLGKGAFGEVWRAISLDVSSTEGHRDIVLKRIFSEKGEFARLSGEREAFFGKWIKKDRHVTRFLERFVEGGGETGEPSELWLAFVNEGFPLSAHIFRTDSLNGGFMTQSDFWWSLKLEKMGLVFLRTLWRQLLLGIQSAHSRGITHRDVKLENLLMPVGLPLDLKLGDWGSSLYKLPDGSVTPKMAAMFGSSGPTVGEETERYRPPEAILGTSADDMWRDLPYDMWSAGVVMLQIVLGSQVVLELSDQRKRAKILQIIRNEPQEVQEEIMYLHGLAAFCIRPRPATPDTSTDPSEPVEDDFFGDSEALVEWSLGGGERNGRGEYDGPKGRTREALNRLMSGSATRTPAQRSGGGDSPCGDRKFAEILQKADPAREGLPNKEARDLLGRMLAFSPKDRIKVDDALKHPFFKRDENDIIDDQQAAASVVVATPTNSDVVVA